jgi:hypothetical protein
LWYSKFLLALYVLRGAVVYLILLRLLRAVDPADLSLLRGFLGPRLAPVSNMLSWALLPKDQWGRKAVTSGSDRDRSGTELV